MENRMSCLVVSQIPNLLEQLQASPAANEFNWCSANQPDEIAKLFPTVDVVVGDPKLLAPFLENHHYERLK
jgi:hypothetical protein